MSVGLTNDEIDREYFTCGTGGGVYFIQGVDGGPVKIGWSKYKPERGRLAIIQLHSPVELRVVARIRGASITLEHDIHRQFAKHRLHGEWFEPEAVLEWVTAYAGGPVTICDQMWPEREEKRPPKGPSKEYIRLEQRLSG